MLATITERLSIGGSLLAGIYQLYLGYLYEGADGFSPVLLCGWLMGDVLNIIGTIWGRQMTFQKVIAITSFLTDVLLTWQHLYYSEKRHKLSLSNASPLLAASMVRCVSAVSTKCTLGDQVEFIIGEGFSWIAESFYVCALVPQVMGNFRRKCTGSVSVVMFVADLFSSVNYLITILVSASGKSSPVEFLLEELPYLYGSTACALLDLTLLAQYAVYPQFHEDYVEGQVVESTPLLPKQSPSAPPSY